MFDIHISSILSGLSCDLLNELEVFGMDSIESQLEGRANRSFVIEDSVGFL